MTRRLAIAVILATAVVAGCSDPYAQTDREPAAPSATPALAAAAPGDTAPLAPLRAPPPAKTSAGSPRAVARAFAAQAASWDWRGYERQLRTLRDLAAGPLVAELDRALAGVAGDESLQRDRPAVSGSVLAVVVRGRGEKRAVVAVTRQHESRHGGAALEGPRARVYLGELVRTAASWWMARWQRQP